MSEAATTLKVVDVLMQAGFTGDQAKGVVIAIGEYRDSQLATKGDFARLELKTAEIRTELEEVKGSIALVDQRVRHLESNMVEKFTNFEARFTSLESRMTERIVSSEASTIEKIGCLETALKKDIQSMEYRLVIKLGVFFVVSMSIALAVVRLF